MIQIETKLFFLSMFFFVDVDSRTFDIQESRNLFCALIIIRDFFLPLRKYVGLYLITALIKVQQLKTLGLIFHQSDETRLESFAYTKKSLESVPVPRDIFCLVVSRVRLTVILIMHIKSTHKKMNLSNHTLVWT